MSEIPKTVEVDKCLVSRFGRAILPPLNEIRINKFSEIPDLVKNLRAMKFGPKLRLSNGDIDIVTTKYQAGYSGQDAEAYGYGESIFMLYGSRLMTHEAIRDELLKMKRIRSNSSLFSKIQEYLQKINSQIASFEALEEEMNEDLVRGAISVTRHLSNDEQKLFIYKVSDQCVPTLKTWMSYFEELIADKFDDLFKKNDPSITSDVTSRILTIWFIAESFRYPPMMLYSMLLLHLYVNDHIDERDFRAAFHPSEIKGSEKAQFYCYLRETEFLKKGGVFSHSKEESDGNNNYLDTAKRENATKIQKIEKMKLAILTRVRDGIYSNFKSLNYSDEKSLTYANRVFRVCIRRYLAICIGKEALQKSNPDLISLTQSLGAVKIQNERLFEDDLQSSQRAAY